MWDFRLFPEQASTVAAEVDTLFLSLVGISGFMVLLLAALIIAFSVKYRKGTKAVHVRRLGEARWLEYAWTLIPFCIFLGLFIWANRLYVTLLQPPAGTLEIQAIGKQWMWKFQHPDGQREINELHVPLGQTVKVTLTSQDVIHSFYVPAFRVKHDVVPGRYATAWFNANQVGTYHLFCAEYCGTDHSRMRGQVVVMEPADYASWLNQQQQQPSLAAQGEQLYRAYGCSGCHDPNSTVHAPSLEGIFGRPVPLQGGGTIIADQAYIRDSILLPNKHIVAGYQADMPSFQGQISEEDLLKIIAYIQSLSGEQTP